ncbi:MAG: permease [Anaerolinea sp.]|nr:permease [Anaerolinea sp.]
MTNFAAIFLGIFIEAVPFLLLGTLASGLVEVYLDQEKLVRWLPRQPLLAAVIGVGLGLVFPVCECGTVPLVRRLLSKGVPPALGMAFLLAAPVINPVVILSTLTAFGPGVVFWGRLGLTAVIALLVGGVLGADPDVHMVLRADAGLTLHCVQADGQLLPGQRFRQVLLVAADEFFEMGRYLVIGAALAALMQLFLPQSWFLAVQSGPVLSSLFLAALAVLLSICSTVDSFVALGFAGWMPVGAVLAFLVYGPMVDIKSVLMFGRVFRKRVVVYLVVLPLVLTLLLTGLINVFWKGG